MSGTGPAARTGQPSAQAGGGPGADLPTIGSLGELAAIVREHGQVYLRHSLGPDADAHQRSRDYESGLELPGLSVVPLRSPAWWTRPAEDWLARQISKYAHLSDRDSRRFAWVLAGEVAGAGPDSEPLIARPRPLGRVGDRALAEARRCYTERFDPGRDSSG